MLNDAELAAMEGAIRAADEELGRLEAAARASSSWPGLLFPTLEQRTYRAARDTLDVIRAVRNAAIEDGDHERALEVVTNARELARPGMVAEAVKDATIGDAIASGKTSVAGVVVKLVPWWLWALLAVVLVVALAPTAAALRMAIGGRR